MNWEAIATVAEVIGAIGVVASLLYVGIQIRQNSETTKAATIAQVLDQSASVSLIMAADKAVASVFARGLEEPSSLEKDERAQFRQIMFALFRRYENSEYQFHQGLLPPENWQALKANMASVVGTPGFQWWWERAQPGISPRIQALVSDMEKG